MAKAKRKFVCQQCGTVTSRWQGQCEDCGEWNSIVEEVGETVFSARHDLQSGGRAISLVALDSKVALPPRTSTGIAEFDRALGGGIVSGSATLIGGDPGIGKSTLLLQAAARIATRGLSVAYISGEEAADQVRLRAQRLGLGGAFELIHDIHACQYVPKPDPAGYDALCKVHDVDPTRAAFFEDMARNLRPAKTIGMTTIWVNNGSEAGNHDHHPDFIDFETDHLTPFLARILGE